MRQLIAYLLENLFLDFRGELDMEKVRQFLRADDSRESRQLLSRLHEDKGFDEMLTTLADCLQESLRTGISEDTIREQVRLYVES